MARRRNVVAVFFNPITRSPCWATNPPPGYKKRGLGEFTNFKGEFTYDPKTAGSLETAIEAAKSLYWQVARGEA